jgi:hypothetical protein
LLSLAAHLYRLKLWYTHIIRQSFSTIAFCYYFVNLFIIWLRIYCIYLLISFCLISLLFLSVQKCLFLHFFFIALLIYFLFQIFFWYLNQLFWNNLTQSFASLTLSLIILAFFRTKFLPFYY